MATSLSLENDSSLAQGYLKVNGSTAATLTTSGITGNLTGNLTGNVTGNLTGNVTGSLTQGGSITLATAQTASGTAVDFTGIPATAKRITVMFSGVSTSGTSLILIQIGSGSVATSGYSSTCTAGTTNVTSTTGFLITQSIAAATLSSGQATISRLGSGNIYVLSAIIAGSVSNAWTNQSGGNVTISGDIDRVRITTVNGTDTFDAGTINILWE
jgi:hypothetical protein